MMKKKIKILLPKKLQVGPVKIKIDVDHKRFEKMCKEEGGLAYGFSSVYEQKIWLDPFQSDDSLADTSLHEVLHIIFELTGVRAMIGQELEEKIISSISTLLLDTMRRNPEYIAYLMEGKLWSDSLKNLLNSKS